MPSTSSLCLYCRDSRGHLYVNRCGHVWEDEEGKTWMCTRGRGHAGNHVACVASSSHATEHAMAHIVNENVVIEHSLDFNNIDSNNRCDACRRDDTAHTLASCSVRHGSHRCSRPEGHDGPHVCCRGGQRHGCGTWEERDGPVVTRSQQDVERERHLRPAPPDPVPMRAVADGNGECDYCRRYGSGRSRCREEIHFRNRTYRCTRPSGHEGDHAFCQNSRHHGWVIWNDVDGLVSPKNYAVEDDTEYDKDDGLDEGGVTPPPAEHLPERLNLERSILQSLTNFTGEDIEELAETVRNMST